METGEEYTVHDGDFIGSGPPCQVIITNPSVSKRQFKLALKHGQCILVHNSTNLSVNEKVLSPKISHPLYNEDRIQIGNLELKFVKAKRKLESSPSAGTQTLKRASLSNSTGGAKSKVRAHLIKKKALVNNLAPSGFKKRLLAYLIDLGYLTIFGVALALALGVAVFSGSFLQYMLYAYLALFIILLLRAYFQFVRSTQTDGQTYGKKVVGIKVVSDRPEKTLSSLQLLLRENPINHILFPVISLFIIFISKSKKSVHDYIAQTKVVDINEEMHLKFRHIVLCIIGLGYVLQLTYSSLDMMYTLVTNPKEISIRVELAYAKIRSGINQKQVKKQQGLARRFSQKANQQQASANAQIKKSTTQKRPTYEDDKYQIITFSDEAKMKLRAVGASMSSLMNDFQSYGSCLKLAGLTNLNYGNNNFAVGIINDDQSLNRELTKKGLSNCQREGASSYGSKTKSFSELATTYRDKVEALDLHVKKESYKVLAIGEFVGQEGIEPILWTIDENNTIEQVP